MLAFQKFQGTGNDFIIFKESDVLGHDYAQLAKSVCDRHFGVGADGMMVVASSEVADIQMCFYNADGSIATMCGNGIRCFAKFVYDELIVEKPKFSVETLARIMNVEVIRSEGHRSQVRVNLGEPVFSGAAIPIGVTGPYLKQPLGVNGVTYEINTLIIGTIRTVIFVEDIEQVDVAMIGPLIENHPVFPLKTNVNFCEVVDKQTLRVSTWEKGVGKTLACGTGVTACAIISSLLFEREPVVKVEVAGGHLTIEKIEESYAMTGDATRICEGMYCFA